MTQLWYPKADHVTQNFTRTWPGDIMPHTNVFLLHSTEGGDWPAYDYEGQGDGSSAPNMTYKRTSRQFRQHFPANMSSRALVNLPGGVETNTLNVFQIEIIGTCDPTQQGKMRDAQGREAPYVPDLDDVGIDDLAHLWLWLHVQQSVPLTALPATSWKAYPSSYGQTPTRLTGDQWEAFTGVCGHQHAPENVHGDPGDFPIDKLLARVTALAGGAGDPPNDPPAGHHPLVQATADAIRAANIANDKVIATHPGWDYAKQTKRTLTQLHTVYTAAATK